MNPTYTLSLIWMLALAAPAWAQTKSFSATGEFTNNCEGPAVDSKGNVYAVNFARDGTVAQITKKGKTSFFMTLPKGSTGNGIRFIDQNTFLIADFTGHNVLKADLLSREISVLVHEPAMNQPNDLAVTSTGYIYCSDPNWKDNSGQIWHVSLDGTSRLEAKDLGTTNGIEVSPDEKKLYVNESVQRSIWVFDIEPDGSLTNKQLFFRFEEGGMDGMRCDIAGNLYVARHGMGQVAVLSPDGRLLQTIQTLGKKVSNICFGGKKGKTAYITLQDTGHLEQFKVKIPGREWALMKQFQQK
ncbi:sugar lactone lactonase YvrE [Dyadobacter jejuensis]|uniref:Sugar lactone lactonase YvrE n=1 Tax=Dyadobacter jejuensis TaxID=1082580 RepID=A0A316AJS6_9BACT|nr:SMP-30/gluconolactonase/LRE family protein [Dyadobacter jejuensis]PWJ57234.1 sugar lactone lactonase YvrE [Dyadobacter jejuensis]